MHQIKGSINFAQLAQPQDLRPVAVGDDWLRLEFPGLRLEWNRRHADLAIEDGVLALASGRPRVGGQADARTGGRLWLERYRQHGNAAAHEVGGGFAVVIVDLRNRRASLLNDRFSMETLCYRVTVGNLAFSNAAAQVPGASGELDPQAIYDYLHFHMIPAPSTVFRDVRRLLAGELLTADSSGWQTSRYWQPQFAEHDFSDLAGRLQRFREIISASVEEEADEPATACFLSGGTDSSTIAGTLTRLRGKPTAAYSIGFEAEGYDEMEYARIAARHFGLDHREYYVTPDDLVAAIPQVAAASDQPFGNSSILPAYYCALKANADGHTRMLAGDGGDELFGGNSRYATQKVFQLYHGVPQGLRRLIEPPAIRWPLFRRVPGFRQLGGYVRHSRISMPDRLETFNLLHTLGEKTVLEPDFLSGIATEHPLEEQRRTWHDAQADSLLNRMLAYDWKYTLADSDLPKVRIATQLAGVSVGYPFLSRAMTDFSLSVPPQWKLKGLKLRWFFKEALRDVLPTQILTKKKQGFGLPFGPWTLRHAGLRDLAEDSLKGIGERGIVRREFIADLLTRRLQEAPGYYGEMVWILMMLEQWLRQQTPASRSV